ncbi:MAG: hypothetical protein MUD13_12175 [Candidatus Nanopelagicales bacterium]|jgi:hypothetical protein|nr:hypothetical protein [Candidatus Nanopelagicales bacterium]
MRTPLPRLALLAGAALLVTLPLTGCSDSADTATTPTTSAAASAPAASAPAGQVCADADTARASLQGLVDLNILQEGTNALKANFDTFKADVDTLIASAQAEFATETDAVKAAVADLQGAIAELAAEPSVADVAALAPALASVKSTTEALLTAVDQAC